MHIRGRVREWEHRGSDWVKGRGIIFFFFKFLFQVFFFFISFINHPCCKYYNTRWNLGSGNFFFFNAFKLPGLIGRNLAKIVTEIYASKSNNNSLHMCMCVCVLYRTCFYFICYCNWQNKREIFNIKSCYI